MKLKSRFGLLILGIVLSLSCFFVVHKEPVVAQSTTIRSLDTELFKKEVQLANGFTMPAEFEAIESIWMAYPVYENMRDRPSQIVQADMIKALVPHVKVDLLVQDQTEFSQVETWIAAMNLPKDRVRLHITPHTDIWMRDMGPIFLKNSKNDLKIADFGFSTWSYSDPASEIAMIDEDVDRLVAREMGLATVRSSLISEGGDREFNGKGTMMATESVELQRNFGLTKEEIEAEFKRIFNLEKVIWLKQGIADDDLSTKGKLSGNVFTVLTTGGHIDEFARFATPNTILLAQVTPQERDNDAIARITDQRLEENYRILKKATDQDGKPFNIIRVPIAAPVYEMMDQKDEIFKLLKDLTFEDGTIIQENDSIKTILAASYLNFVIANDVVLIPSYWKTGRPEIFRQKDNAAKQIFQQVFPDRKIVQINAENINAGGGGMHCIVQQMPKFATASLSR